MKRETLRALGLDAATDIPASELFSSSFVPSMYGLTDGDAARLKALHDFVSQYSRELPPDTSSPVADSSQAAALMYGTLRGLDHEEIWIVLLNSHNIPLSKQHMSTGTVDASLFDCRAIVKKALDCKASGVLLFHNHPSGVPQPSTSDVKMTDSLQKALALFDISLVDHIIISDTTFFSFKDESCSRYSG